MDFSLTQDQTLLKDSVDRLMRDRYSFEQRRTYRLESGGWSRRVWQAFADLGLLALPFDVEDGGLGYGPVETMLVMEVLGRALVLEPYLSTVVIAGSLLREAAHLSRPSQWVRPIIAGERSIAVATTELRSRFDLCNVTLEARRGSTGYRLFGEKILIPHGDSADMLLVSARTSGTSNDPQGVTLFLLSARSDGLRQTAYRTHDGMRASDIAFNGVHVEDSHLVGNEGEGAALLERSREYAIAALAAEAVGVMQEMLDMTLAYLQQRKQFGTAIGRFQALQHRAAEMLIELEQARSMAVYAALMLDEPDAHERRRSMSAVKAQIGKSGRVVGQLAIQLHGGMGVSDEYAIAHYFRRLMVIESLHGDQAYHLSRFAA